MGLQKLPRMLHAKQGKQRILSPSSAATRTPKVYLSIYVGERKKKRFLVSLAYLRHPSFQALLNLSQDEFGYAHPVGGLTFSCKEETFIELTRDIRSRSIALNVELRPMKLGDLSYAYFRKIESIATILSSLGLPISNDDVVNIALDGLPDEYQ
ncbi:auxin responsive SAUR protein [Tanacetum coccineum]